jgi:UDP-glucose 4-epimerase
MNHYPIQMAKVAVTGGAGFVGSNLVRALLNENHEVLVIDDFSTGLKGNLKNLDCQIEEISLLDAYNLNKALQEAEYIFHLGARGSVPRSIKDPRATIDVNVLGTLNVLETARVTGASVAFSSSSSVYGSNLFLPKNEKMWMSPLTPYAASKLSCEALVASYASSFGISAITYRFFNIFGPWQRPDHNYAAVIPKWIWKLMLGESIEVFGDGNQTRDFTYVDVVVEVLIRGLNEKVVHPEPINLALGAQISLNQCIDELRLRFPNLRVTYSAERIGDVRHSQNDPTLLNTIFPGINPISFSRALEETYQWILESRSSFAKSPLLAD